MAGGRGLLHKTSEMDSQINTSYIKISILLKTQLKEWCQISKLYNSAATFNAVLKVFLAYVPDFGSQVD